jgi:acyl dehydratase
MEGCMWKYNTLTEQAIKPFAKDIVFYSDIDILLNGSIKQITDFINKNRGSAITIQIEAGESQVTNYDREVSGKVPLDPGVLSQRRGDSMVNFLKQYFEDLEISETLITEKHTVTLDDIEKFAELSGDKFYAHMDENALDGTIFTGRVAHGYFILSRAAGLFVDAPKGPVLLNYGIDECRFTKPVYPGSSIAVRFTCKEKIEQEKKNPEDIAKGIVKFLVDIYDETGETVAIATILTMVKKRNQN